MRTFTSRTVALVATVAMSTAGLIGLASSANAAPVSLKFNCSASILSNQEFSLDIDVKAPASVEVGDTITTSFTGTVTAPNTVRQSAYALLNGRSIGGPAAIDGKFGGAAVALTADAANTEIPGGTTVQPLVLPATGGGSFEAKTVGTQTLTVDGFKATLKMTKADGSVSDVAVTCTAKDPAAVVATIEVKDKAPEPTPTPTVTAEPSPTATPTVEPSPTDTATPTPTETPKPTATATPAPNDPLKTLIAKVLKLVKKLACLIIKC